MFLEPVFAWFTSRSDSGLELRAGRVVTVSAAAILFAGAALWGLSAPPPGPVEVRLLRTEAYRLADSKTIGVEFVYNRASRAWFDSSPGSFKVQLRLDGRWQPPVDVPGADHLFLFSRTNREEARFMVPAHTQACRFLVGYGVGRPPYCDAYFFLARHGLLKKYPKLCRQVLKCFRGRVWLRHAAPELVLAE